MGLICVLLAAAPIAIADWEYRWGDHGEWVKLQLPAHPPRDDGTLWERTQLPQFGRLKDPALKLDAVIRHLQLYADGQRLYVHPPEGIDAKGVAGLPWHLVSLPQGTHEVALRIKSSYRLPGIHAVPHLAERS